MNYTMDIMIDTIVEYMECAGFADYYEREVSHWSEESIKENFEYVLNVDPDFVEYIMGY